MAALGLTALFGTRAARFKREAWPNAPFVAHGPLARLAGLLPRRRDLGSLLALPAAKTYAQVRQGPRFSNTEIAPEAAPAMHAAGLSVYLWEVALEAHAWLAALRTDLALGEGLPRVGLFASRTGVGAPIHFDGQESLVVQLIGKKEWTIGQNHNVAWPAINHVAVEPVPPELAPIWRGRAPSAGDTTLVLKPGSVMFLPRGYWHTTRTLDDSVHLDLMMPLPTWADVLVAEFSEQLQGDPRWREPAVDAGRTGQMAGALRAEAQRFEARSHAAAGSRPARKKTSRR